MIRDFATLLLGEFPARGPRLLGDFPMFHLEFTNNSDGPIVPRNRKQKELSLRHCVNPKCGTRGEAGHFRFIMSRAGQTTPQGRLSSKVSSLSNSPRTNLRRKSTKWISPMVVNKPGTKIIEN